MATNNTISAYSGYTFVIPEKLTLNMTTSFETGRSYNYGPSIYIEVDGKRIGITYDDLLDLSDEIQKMLDLAKNIPHTENVNGFYR
jgi:hypothetical protein